jgi:putative FmdB family regulatory protein
MPTYAYRCGKDHLWEAGRPIAERRDPIACPTCGHNGTLVITKAPHLMWYPDSGRADYKK